MRDIKFRAFVSSKMVNVESIDFISLNECIVGFDTIGGQRRLAKIDPDKLMQFTGLQDKNGADIYFDSLINVFFTSSDCEDYHDCIYRVVMGELGIEMRFESLLWESDVHNQYPSSTTLSERYGSLRIGYVDQEGSNVLMVPESFGKNNLLKHEWKENDESMYFEVIGSAQENPELLRD